MGLRIDNSKGSSTNSPNWGSVNKTALKNRLKEERSAVIREAFAKVGDIDSQSTWGFPHHVVRLGKLVVHVGGVRSAFAAAMGARSGQRASPGVVSHIRKHLRTLGIGKEMEEELY